jgi:ABC-type uncharacterized transport system permease subunit
MTVARRVLCGIVGAVLVLYVVVVFQSTHTIGRGYVCTCAAPGMYIPEPYLTVASYLVSVAGLYLLSAAAVGDRIRSRYWFLYLIIAHILAAALVGGLMIWWEFFTPPDRNLVG